MSSTGAVRDEAISTYALHGLHFQESRISTYRRPVWGVFNLWYRFSMTNPTTPPIRHVVIHTPGPTWLYGVDFRQQPGVGDHVQHYFQLYEQGKLEIGGPFLIPDAGGMMVTTKSVSREEIEAFAADDPAVKSGLLKYEVRPWYNPMDSRSD
jgi:uncharacterized protein YciI